MREVITVTPPSTDREAEAQRRYQGRHRMKGVGQEVRFWYLFSASFLSSWWGPQSGLQPLNCTLWKCCSVHVQGQIVWMWVFTRLILNSCRKFCVFTARIHKAPVCAIPASRRRGKRALRLLPAAAWVPRGSNHPDGDGGEAPHSLL